LTSETGLLDFQIGSKRKRKVLIKEIQSDPIKQTLLHVDIMGVKLKEKITVAVPVRLLGEAVGVKEQGGILHHYLREIEVSCLPLEIQEFVEVDVTDLKIGDSITLETLSLENAEIVGDLEQPIVNVVPPTVVKETVEKELEEELEGEEVSEEAEESTEEES
jgi:large subunit ribosomal protein L25